MPNNRGYNMTKNYIGTEVKFKTFKEAEELILNSKSLHTSYQGIYQTPDGYPNWYIWKNFPPSLAKKFMQNPNREDLESPHTALKEDILKLWITQENGKYLKEPKLIWTKKNQKQNPEPTLEETIKNYLKKQRI